jgi:GH25 family lysozyme M1 (1,4-beta-N-acetylmuramidase)
MKKIFNIEEEARLYGIVDDYRAIYDQANFIAVQMQKMELEMAELLTKMEALKEEESTIYTVVTERSGVDIEEVKTTAGNLILAKQEKIVENS